MDRCVYCGSQLTTGGCLNNCGFNVQLNGQMYHSNPFPRCECHACTLGRLDEITRSQLREEASKISIKFPVKEDNK